MFLFWCLEIMEESVWTLSSVCEHLKFFVLCGLNELEIQTGL